MSAIDAVSDEPFDAPVRGPADAVSVDALIVNIDGFEGPLDLLLELARAQKVDLRRISVLALVEQYLAFMDAARLRDLDLAADYLVMAAWLAYLKSRLLLPATETAGEEPTADEMAAQLAFQLQRLEAMRKASDALSALPQLGAAVFTRGAPEGLGLKKRADWQASIYDLLAAYARQRVAAIDRTYVVEPPKIYPIEEARLRLERIIPQIPDWIRLELALDPSEIDAPRASVIASAFNAALEFAKSGRIDLRQLAPFDPIYVRASDSERSATC
jgi:segregation and condensation protein A